MKVLICDAYAPDGRRVKVLEPKPLGSYARLQVFIDDVEVPAPGVDRMRDGGTTRFTLIDRGDGGMEVRLVLHRRIGQRHYETWNGEEMRRPSVDQRCSELVTRAREVQRRNEEPSPVGASSADVAELAVMVAELAELCRSNAQGLVAVGSHPALV
jgi:hypothetical protein